MGAPTTASGRNSHRNCMTNQQASGPSVAKRERKSSTTSCLHPPIPSCASHLAVSFLFDQVHFASTSRTEKERERKIDTHRKEGKVGRTKEKRKAQKKELSRKNEQSHQTDR
mmetsp:Transcript_31190/g.61487  ORF Transcript_31190/g.61487 Transcript_31190/m.61487 type:complete len:112 (+) Transcript_31190:2118-2453(+)